MWQGFLADKSEYPIHVKYQGSTMRGKAHQKHVSVLKRHKHYGKHTIVVWSAGGEEHARNICDQLKITEFVDHFLAKPDYYYDDLHCSEFMGIHKYLSEGNLKKGCF
jgi:hypothetical protein